MTILELLTDPSCWTKGAYARNVYGDMVATASPTAICWCITGAMLKLYPGTGAIRLKIETTLAKMLGTQSSQVCVERWQDDPARTHSEVLALLRDANV